MIVFVTRDLFFIPLLKTAAEKQNCSMLTVPNASSVRLDELTAEEVTACVIDLTSVSLAEIATAAESLQKRFAPVQLIAFGPHVNEQHLAAAHSAGFDSVLTRGQLNANIDRHMQHWAMQKP